MCFLPRSLGGLSFLPPLVTQSLPLCPSPEVSDNELLFWVQYLNKVWNVFLLPVPLHDNSFPLPKVQSGNFVLVYREVHCTSPNLFSVFSYYRSPFCHSKSPLRVVLLRLFVSLLPKSSLARVELMPFFPYSPHVVIPSFPPPCMVIMSLPVSWSLTLG